MILTGFGGSCNLCCSFKDYQGITVEGLRFVAVLLVILGVYAASSCRTRMPSKDQQHQATSSLFAGFGFGTFPEVLQLIEPWCRIYVETVKPRSVKIYLHL